MQLAVRLSPILVALTLAGCGANQSADFAVGPTLAQPNPDLGAATVAPAATETQVTAQTTATGVSIADVATYVDATALASLSANDKAQAAGAQFNALTFGRPGAPRAWAGDAGVSGQIIVGPYVRVNDIDCRNFTHTVTVKGTPYAKKGMACKDATGAWTVTG